MNIAILGGRFDPPHVFHFWTAQQVLENVVGIDQVWYLPDWQNAFKEIISSSAERLSMLKFMETGRIKISNLAISLETTYTVSVIQELVRDVNNRYYLIVGSDILKEFTKWRDYLKLTRMVKFLVIPRKDYPIKIMPPGFIRVEGNLMLSNVSSSIIRERVKNGRTISGLVFREVEEFIRRNNLYK